MNRTAKLYDRDGKLVKEIEMPGSLDLIPPEVIFYGVRAFHSLLVGRGHYHECSCWRAAEDEETSQVAS